MSTTGVIVIAAVTLVIVVVALVFWVGWRLSVDAETGLED